MANACSHERTFYRTYVRRHSRVTLLLCGVFAGIVASGCLADPRHTQTVELLDRLSSVRVQLQQNPPPAEACTTVGDIETRLYGEPGLVEVQPTWSRLADAAHALQAVCGQSALLAQPISGSPALEAARARWLQGVQRELSVSCDDLRAAASSLNRDSPC